MIPIPASAILPQLPMPELAAGLVTVTLLAATATLTALAVLIAGLVRERRITRILLARPTPATPRSARSAA